MMWMRGMIIVYHEVLLSFSSLMSVLILVFGPYVVKFADAYASKLSIFYGDMIINKLKIWHLSNYDPGSGWVQIGQWSEVWRLMTSLVFLDWCCSQLCGFADCCHYSCPNALLWTGPHWVTDHSLTTGVWILMWPFFFLPLLDVILWLFVTSLCIISLWIQLVNKISSPSRLKGTVHVKWSVHHNAVETCKRFQSKA